MPAPAGAEHPLFPGEPAPNVLAEFVLGTFEGEHVLTLEAVDVTLSIGKIVVRKE